MVTTWNVRGYNVQLAIHNTGEPSDHDAGKTTLDSYVVGWLRMISRLLT